MVSIVNIEVRTFECRHEILEGEAIKAERLLVVGRLVLLGRPLDVLDRLGQKVHRGHGGGGGGKGKRERK